MGLKNYLENAARPWVQKQLKNNWEYLREEFDDSEEMLSILWRYSQGYEVSTFEKTKARGQLLRLVRLVPALTIFLLPGGMLLLPLLARALPWDLLPKKEKKKKNDSP